MKAKAVVAVLIPLACAIACGSFGEGTSPPESSTDDGGASAIDGNAGVDAPSASDVVVDSTVPSPPLKLPPSCPLVDCPGNEDACKDEACDDPASQDFAKNGIIDIGNGKCTVASSPAGSSSGLTRTLPRTLLRTNVVLAVTVSGIGPGDGIIMEIAISGQPTAERVFVTRRGNDLELCEHDGKNRLCSPPLTIALPATLHLWGLVTSETPPKAKFALGTGCNPDRTIEMTKAFPSGDITGSVGCLDHPNGCSMELDDALILLRAE